MMTRKHFIRLASILELHEADANLIRAIGYMCAEDNPNFNLKKFEEAALGLHRLNG
jgi:hypothetical protein